VTQERADGGDRVGSLADDLPIEDVIEVQGDVAPRDQDAVLDPDELEHEREPSMTELDDGGTAPDRLTAGGASALLDGLDLEDIRVGETDDPIAAIEEGMVYVPPIDPPVVADPEADDGITIAAGMGVSAESEPYDESHRSEDLTAEPELAARVRDALRADSATSRLADRLVVGTRGSIAVIRGVVDDVDDGDDIVEVVSRVSGISEVVDQTELAE